MPKPENISPDIINFRERVDELFESAGNIEPLEESEWSPDMDLLEDKDDIIIKVDVPGMKADEIDLTISGNMLYVKGNRKRESNRADENYHFIGRKYGKFSLSIPLPASIDSENVRALYKDGVLVARLPKLEKRDFGKIEVKVN